MNDILINITQNNMSRFGIFLHIAVHNGDVFLNVKTSQKITTISLYIKELMSKIS